MRCKQKTAFIVALLNVLLCASAFAGDQMTFVQSEYGGGIIFHPREVLVSPDGRHVYVSALRWDDTIVWERDPDTGMVSNPIFAYDYEPVAYFNPGMMDFSPDGGTLYQGTDTGFAIHQRDYETGVLTHLQFFLDGVGQLTGFVKPRCVDASPDGLNVAVKSEWGIYLFGLATPALSLVDAMIDELGPASGLQGVSQQCVAFSPDGQHVYTTSWIDGALSVFSVHDNVALVYVEEHFDEFGGLRSVTVSPDGKHVYVSGATTDFDEGIAIFARDQGTGALTFVDWILAGVDVAAGLFGALAHTMSGLGHYLYVTGSNHTTAFDDDTLAAFQRDPATGLLSFLEVEVDGVGGTIDMDNPLDVALSPDGRFAYVTSLHNSTLVVFELSDPDASTLFRDGFESGDASAWSE